MAKTSAPAQNWIAVFVGLRGRTEPAVIADRDYLVHISADGGRVSGNEVTILKGRSNAATAVVRDTAGSVVVSAKSDQSLQPTSDTAIFCATTPITDFKVSGIRHEAPADGKTPIVIAVSIVDKEDQPTMGQQTKKLSADPKGVGIWVFPTGDALPRSDWELGENECEIKPNLISQRSGSASLSLEFRHKKIERSFDFYAELTFALIIWTIVGALGGTSVHVFAYYRRRTVQSYLKRYFIGVLSGIALLLAAYFGVVSVKRPFFPSGVAIGVLFGLIGGFLGVATFELIARKIGAVNPNASIGGSSKGKSN